MKDKTSLFFGLFLLMLLGSSSIVSSCKKDKIITGGNLDLSFSTDTLTFDTVFVSLGSTTKYFTVKNNSKNPVQLDKIYLKDDANGAFRLTIDGDRGNTAQQVMIPGKDSIYIFVEVTVDPNSEQLPFIISDEVIFESGNTRKQIALQAYGQNAHFYNNAEIGTETWTDDLPYVILNSMTVKEGEILTIGEGTTVYFGGNSGMFVKGTLKINGGIDTTRWVTFRGYRLDKQVTGVPYDKLPGQWLGVFIMRGSQYNEIENFRMRGSQFGLNVGNTEVDKLDEVSNLNAPDLTIDNSIIYNASLYGIFGFYARIYATNILIYNVGKSAFYTTMGGDYHIRQGTFYLNSSAFYEHKSPTVYLSDYNLYDENKPALTANLNVQIVNTVIDGTLQDEILFDILNYTHLLGSIENTSIRIDKNLPSELLQNQIIKNQDNGFENVIKTDFRLKENSILINKGKNIMVPTDILGNIRDAQPDIGAFEYIN